MDILVQGVGWFVEIISREMPRETDFTKPMDGTWYLSPTRHGIETILLTAFFYVIFMLTIKRVCRPGSPQWKLLVMYDNTLPTTVLEMFLIGLSVFSWILILVYKIQRNEWAALLQPCHVNLLVLIFLLVFPKKYTLPHFIYNVFIYGLWGTTIAIAQPDLRGYDRFFEAENFWLEHYLLLLAPVLLMLTNRYVLWPPSFTVGIMSFSLNALYNIPILSTIALLSGQNVNYMLSPPPGILEWFGGNYRLFVLAVTCLLSFLIRLIFISGSYFITEKVKPLLGFINRPMVKVE